ncbi:MAG: hypothetical protein ACJ8BW_30735 [Ktedonobacteraceae bacterium]|jgi:hypothetical protein
MSLRYEVVVGAVGAYYKYYQVQNLFKVPVIRIAAPHHPHPRGYDIPGPTQYESTVPQGN